MVDRQWVISVIVVLVGLAAVIGVILYLNAYFSQDGTARNAGERPGSHPRRGYRPAAQARTE